MKPTLLFIAGALALGAATLGAGYGLWGEKALIEGAGAFALTFVPAAIALGWVMHAGRKEPEMRLMAWLGGSGIRMGVALGGAYILREMLPQQFGDPILWWLVFFYPVFLASEIAILLRLQPKVVEPTPRAQ